MNCKNNCNYRSNMQQRTAMPNAVPARMSCDMLQGLPLAMAYVPRQHYDQMFDLGKALNMGTIFPELCLPFCGKRRVCSCQTTK